MPKSCGNKNFCEQNSSPPKLQQSKKALLPCLFSHNIILHWSLDEQTICPDLETEPQALAQKHVQYFWYLWYVVRVVSGIRGTWYVVRLVRGMRGT